MSKGMRTVIVPVTDLDRAKALYAILLGTAPEMDQPYYVGWSVDGQDIGLDPNGHAKGMTGPVPYCHVDDIAATLAALVAGGAVAHQDVTEVGGGRRIASVKDADGNIVGLLQG